MLKERKMGSKPLQDIICACRLLAMVSVASYSFERVFALTCQTKKKKKMKKTTTDTSFVHIGGKCKHVFQASISIIHAFARERQNTHMYTRHAMWVA